MKIVFFGSSEFSLSALEACLSSRYRLEWVVTTPDQPQGRGLNEAPNPVRVFCKANRIPVEAPARLSDPIIFEKIKSCQPDVFVVSSYGKLIPAVWLELPRMARLNVHPSLLPKYRGAAPIHWAILNGDTETGVSVMDITSELDAGDIFHQIAVPLDSQIDAESLSRQLAELSGRMVGEILPLAQNGSLIRTPQDHGRAVYARKLKKSDGQICWKKSAEQIHNMIRGLLPWPTAFFEFKNGVLIQLLKSRVVDASELSVEPGQVCRIDRAGTLHVQTGCGVLGIEVLKPAGKREMNGTDFANGWRLQIGSRLEKG